MTQVKKSRCVWIHQALLYSAALLFSGKEMWCKICMPVRMDRSVFTFSQILPQLVMDTIRVFYRLRAKNTVQESFNNPSQHIRNVGLLVRCEECDMWKLLFCKFKLNYQEVSELRRCLDDISYTCEVSFSGIPGHLKDVCVQYHRCNDPIDKLYYSCEFESILYRACTQELFFFYATCTDGHMP